MQRFLLSLLLVLGSSFLFSQEFIGADIYPQFIGNINRPFETADFILPTSDGGYLLVGSFEYAPGDYDGRIVKISADGDVLEDVIYGFGGNDHLYGVVETMDYYYFIGDVTNTENGINYPVLVKTTKELGFIDNSSYSGQQYGKGLTIEETYDNKLLIGGYRQNGAPSGGNTIGFFQKVNTDLTAAGPATDMGNAIGKITRSTDGNYYMFGTTYNGIDNCIFNASGDAGNLVATNSIPVNTNSGDLLVAKYDASLIQIWEQEIGGDTPDSFIDGIATPDGGFALIGQTECVGEFGDEVGPNNIAIDTDGFLHPYWFYKGNADHALHWISSLPDRSVNFYPFGLINSCVLGEYVLAYQINEIEGNDIRVYRVSEAEPLVIEPVIEVFSNRYTGRSIAKGMNGDIGIAGYSYDFIDNGNDFAFFQFSPEPVCANCLCVEDDPYLPTAYQCDNFNDYALGDITPQSGNWRRWPGTTGDGQVEQLGAPDNQVLRIANDVPAPDIVYDVNGSLGPNITSGRHRFSWEMFVEPGFMGYYNFQYEKEVLGMPGNWAFHMFFDADGTGRLVVGGQDLQTFTYPPGETFKVAHIIDLEEDKMEFWLDHDYKLTTQYTEAIGNTLTPGIGAINFFAHQDSTVNYWIDNICIRTTGSTETCGGGPVFLTVFEGEVCTENGQNYLSACDAGNNGLYAIEEYGECLSICEYNAEFIGRDDLEGISGSLAPSDLAPTELYAVSCVQNDFPGAYPLYADIYVLNNETGQDINVTPPPGAQVYIFDCLGDGGQNCVSAPFTVGFYYIVIVSDQVTPNYTIQVFPSSICDVSAGTPLLMCGDSFTGTVDNQSDVLDAVGSNAAYGNCYSGLRTYQGNEQIFRLEITEASIVDISLMTSSGQGGVFLFNSNCGTGCINYAEAPNGGGSASLQDLTLGIGNYYLVVDQETDIGSFMLSINCEYDENNGGFGGIFAVTSTTTSPTCELSASVHNIIVQIADTAAFTAAADYFIFNDKPGSGNSGFFNEEQAQAFNGMSELVFNIPESLNPEERCSYIQGDTLQLYVLKSNSNTATAIQQLMTFEPIGAGVTSTDLFETGGNSVISDFSDAAQTTYIQVPTSILFPRSGSIDTSYWLLGDAWNARTEQEWITMDVLSPADGVEESNIIASEGNAVVELRVNPNPGYTARLGSIDVRTNDSLVRQTIQIVQPGRCVLPVLSSPVPEYFICAGESAILSVNALPAPVYDYQWSNGATGNAIITVAPIETTTYTVTVTQASSVYCTAENTLSFVVNVEPPIPVPVSTGNQLICMPGQNATLAVNVNNSLYAVDWYSSPTSTNPLDTDTPTYSTNVPNTYYAQARDRSNGSCVSERIPVSLLLNPPINLTTEQSSVMICEDEQVELNVQLSGGIGTFSYQWRNQNGQLLSTQATYTYVPSGPGTTTITLDVFDSNDCPASQDFAITAVAAPVISSYTPPNEDNCSDDLTTYQFTLNTDGEIQSPAFGLLENLGGDNYLISAIPAGQDLELTIDNGVCTVPLFVQAPTCECEAAIAAPVSMGDVIACGIDEVVPLQVTLENSTEYTVNWYNEEGVLVLPNSLTLTTIEEGTYFAQTTSILASQCTSASSTPVVLEIRPELMLTGLPSITEICIGQTLTLTPEVTGGLQPYTYRWRKNGVVVEQAATYIELVGDADPFSLELEVTDVQGVCSTTEIYTINVIDRPELELVNGLVCSSDLTTYSFDIISNSDNLTLTVPQAVLQDNGGGSYSVLNVPVTNDILITATNSVNEVNCESSLAITAPDCSCEGNIPPPVSAGDVVACAGDIIPPLTVMLGNPETYTVNWYNENNDLVAENRFMLNETEPGTYYAETVNLDASQCTSATRTAVSLEIRPALEISSDQTVQTICQGEMFSLTPEIVGGMMPYEYMWRKGNVVVGQGESYMETVDNLVPVVLELEVTDANEVCIATETFVVSVISPPALGQVTGVVCSEDLTTYSFDIISSTANLELSLAEALLISNGGTSYTVSNVPVDMDITVTGINEVNLLSCETLLSINAPTDCNCGAQQIPAAEPVSATYSVCADSPYPLFEIIAPADNYTVEWYTDPSDMEPFLEGELTYQPTEAVTVYVRLKDIENNCTSDVFSTISLVVNDLPVPNAGQNITACVGTTLELDGTASQGAGMLAYSWSEELPIEDSGSATPIITITQDATITLTVTDENGCSATDFLQVDGLVNPELNLTIADSILCFGNSSGSLNAQVTSGTLPYQYDWSTGDQNIAFLTGLPAGEYGLTITDANNCTGENLILLEEPDNLSVNANIISQIINEDGVLFPGQVEAIIEGGTPPYTINWLDENGISISDSITLVTLDENIFILLVRDANECERLIKGVELVVDTDPVSEDTQRVTAFPNPTAGSLRIVFSQAVNELVDLAIYDILGRQLSFASFAGNGGRDFNLDLTTFPTGTYWIRIRIADIFHQLKVIKI